MITEKQYKELDSKLKSVIGTLEYLVACNQREPENVTCYHFHSLNEPIQTLMDAKEILMGKAYLDDRKKVMHTLYPPTEKPEVTICKECKFAEREGLGDPTPSGFCLNEDAPVTEFVEGNRSCGVINKGNCGFFKPLVDPEPK